MSTFGHPGRYTYCIGENEEASPWPPFHAGRGLSAETSAVTLFAGDAPHGISDHSSRTARELGGSLGWSMAGLWNSKHFPLYSHTMLVVGPEHARTFADGGWSKDDLKRHLHETVRRPYQALLPDADHGEGTNLRYGKSESRREEGAMIPKFASTEEIHVIVAGGTPAALAAKNATSTIPIAFNVGVDPVAPQVGPQRRIEILGAVVDHRSQGDQLAFPPFRGTRDAAVEVGTVAGYQGAKIGRAHRISPPACCNRTPA